MFGGQNSLVHVMCMCYRHHSCCCRSLPSWRSSYTDCLMIYETWAHVQFTDQLPKQDHRVIWDQLLNLLKKCWCSILSRAWSLFTFRRYLFLILAFIATLLFSHPLDYAVHGAPWDLQKLCYLRRGPSCTQRLEHGGSTFVFSSSARRGLTCLGSVPFYTIWGTH